MSDKLTLADVEPGHYYMIEGQLYWFDSYIDNPAIGNPCSLLRIPSGHSRHVTPKKARNLPVELMELVPKDRESDLLGIIQEIKDEHRNRLTPRCWNLVNDAIEEATGE